MDKRVPVSYSDPERLVVYAPSSTRPSPRPSPSPYPPSPISSRSSASIRSYAWNPALFAVDRSKRLPSSRQILTYWRMKKRGAIGITILVFVAVASIVAGITAGVLERQHTSRATSPLNNTSSRSISSFSSITSSRSTSSLSNNTASSASSTKVTMPPHKPSPSNQAPVPTSPTDAFKNALWIWNDSKADDNATWISLGFRKTFSIGEMNEAFVLLTARGGCQLYTNGNMVKNKTSSWESVDMTNVTLNQGTNVFAVKATNKGGTPAGLLVSVWTIDANGNTSILVSSDPTWHTSTSPQDEFYKQNFTGAESWGGATVPDGSGAWTGKLKIPANFTTTITAT